MSLEIEFSLGVVFLNHSFRFLFAFLPCSSSLFLISSALLCVCVLAGMRLFVCLIAIALRPLSDFVIALRLLLSYIFFPNLFNFVFRYFLLVFWQTLRNSPFDLSTHFNPFFGMQLVICCFCLLSRQLKIKLGTETGCLGLRRGIFSFQRESSIRLFSHIPLVRRPCCLLPLCLFAFCLQFAWAIII